MLFMVNTYNPIEDTEPKSKLGGLWLILLPFAAFALGIGVGYLAWGQQSIDSSVMADAVQATIAAQPTSEEQPAAGIPQEPPQDIKRYDVPVDDDYIYGSEDAPITIVEFSDFQCPYCSRWYVEVLEPLLAMYPGQIRFVYRDFPLISIHPEAVPAAVAANCAGEQGKYYDFHNSIFSGDYGLSADAYKKYAADLGLDNDAFATCIEEDRYRDEVMADLEWATGFGVQSTPTFFVNGIPMVGAQPLEMFTTLIDWELEGKLPKGD